MCAGSRSPPTAGWSGVGRGRHPRQRAAAGGLSYFKVDWWHLCNRCCAGCYVCTQRAGWPPRRQPLATVVGRRRGMRPRRWRCQLRAAHPRRSAALRCLRARGRGRSAWRGLPHAHARCVHAPRCGGGPSGGNPLSFVVWVVCLLRPWPPVSPQRWPDLGSLNSVVGSPRTAVRTFPGTPEADAPEVFELRTQVPPAVAALEDGGEHSYGTVRTVAGPTDRPLS